MRGITFLGLAALLATSGCGGEIEPEAEEEIPDDTGGVAATITASGTSADCTFAWNGEPMSADGLAARAIVVMGDAIDQNGGVYNMVEDDLPIIRFEAVADAPFLLHVNCRGRGAVDGVYWRNTAHCGVEWGSEHLVRNPRRRRQSATRRDRARREWRNPSIGS